MGYFNDWKEAITKEKNIEPPEGYPHSKLWGFVSFIFPLMLLPLAAKGIKMGIEAFKKSKDKKKK